MIVVTVFAMHRNIKFFMLYTSNKYVDYTQYKINLKNKNNWKGGIKDVYEHPLCATHRYLTYIFPLMLLNNSFIELIHIP